MKTLVIGSNGFIGKAVIEEAKKSGLEVFGADIKIIDQKNNRKIDLSKKDSIRKVILEEKPDFIINCAGIVKADKDEVYNLNYIFTKNLLEAIIETNIKPKKIVVLGSASEYGVVGEESLPVSEEQKLVGANSYAKSKIKETQEALSLRKSKDIPVVVARLFNPIGRGMGPGFLVPRLLKEIEEVEQGVKNFVEISRLDASRDYVDVSDIAKAVLVICLKDAQGPVYNIGSGKKTSNKEILELVAKSKNIKLKLNVKETQKDPEPIYAVCADISKIKKDTSWSPEKTLEDIIKRSINE